MKKLNALLLLAALIGCQFAEAQTLISAAGERIVKSSDGGKSWDQIWDADMDSKVQGAFVNSVAQGNGLIIAAGSTLVVSKDKGQSWKEIAIVGHTGSNNLLAKYLTHITFSDGVFLLAFPFRVAYSTDGETWTYIKKNKPATLAGGTAGAEKPVATEEKEGDKKGSGGMSKGLNKLKSLRSSSGTEGSQSSQSSNESKTASSHAYPSGLDEALDFVKSPLNFTFLNGQFILTGGNRSMEMAILKKEGNEIKVVKIFDLYTEYGNAATLDNGGLGAVAWDGKSTLVVVAQHAGKSAYSLNNGVTWKFFKNPREASTTTVTFGKDRFVASNSFGEIFTATDITKGWTGPGRFYDRPKVAYRLAYDGKKFLVFCSDMEVYASADATTWDAVTQDMKVGTNLYDVVTVK